LTSTFELGPDFCTLHLTAKFHHRMSEVTVLTNKQTDKLTNKQAGEFLRPDCAPSSERPQFRMPAVRNAPSFDRSTTPRRRFDYNIPASVVLLQQCHCRNRHRGKLYLLPQFCSNRVEIFLQYTGDTDAKMMDQNFEIRVP